MLGFSGKWTRTYGRTDGRKNEGESKGPLTPSRDQKAVMWGPTRVKRNESKKHPFQESLKSQKI